MCRADVRNSEKYLEWLDEECNLLVDSKEEISKKIQAEKKNILDTAIDTETLKLVRERSSGPMIADTEKTVFFAKRRWVSEEEHFEMNVCQCHNETKKKS